MKLAPSRSTYQILKKNQRTEEQSQTEKASKTPSQLSV